MKPFAHELPVLELGEGSVVADYRVGASVPRRSYDERVHEALSEKGRPATIVFAHRGEEGRAGKTRFRRLARSRARLEHPALIPVHEFGDLDSFRYLISDPYPPRTFADQLDEGPLSPREIIGLLAPVATALDLAHVSGVVHQSLAAESLLRVGDHLVVDAFSLAGGGVDPVFGSSRGGAHPLYISPEAGKDEAVEPASNVYSLTAIMVHALTGRPPFEGDAASVVYAHLVEGPPRPSERIDGLPDAIDAVVATGMAKDPALRQRKALFLLQAAATALDVPFHPLQGQTPRPGKVRAPSRRSITAKQPDQDSLAWESASSPGRPGGSPSRPAPPVPRTGDRIGRGPSPRPPASRPRIPEPERRVAGSKSPAVRSNGAAASVPKRPARSGRPPAGDAAKRAGATAMGVAKTGATKGWAATAATAATAWTWTVAAAAAVWALAKRTAATGWPMAKRGAATLWAWVLTAATAAWALVKRVAASGSALAVGATMSVANAVRRGAATAGPRAKRGAARADYIAKRPARPIAKSRPATVGAAAGKATAAGRKAKQATATATAGTARGAGRAPSKAQSGPARAPGRMPSLAAVTRRVRPGRAWALAIPVVAVGLVVGVLLASGGGADDTAARPDPVAARNARSVNALEDLRLDRRATLADADSAPGQAQAAIALAETYRSTAGVAPSRALAAAAEEVAVTYEGLATAARREDGGRFADASRAVDAAEEDFQATAARVLGRP